MTSLQTSADLGEWQSTIMSIVRGAVDMSPELRREQFDRLVRYYRPPMIAYLHTRLRVPLYETDDIVQSFLVRKLLEPAPEDNLASRYLHANRKRIRPEEDALPTVATDGAERNSSDSHQSRIRFRDYLRRALKNYYIDQRRKFGNEPLSLAAVGDGHAVSDHNDDEDIEFDQTWAKNILKMVIDAVRDDCLAKNQHDIWFAFCERILRPVETGEPPATYEALCATGRFTDEKQAANRYQTAVRKFRDALKTTVAHYLPSGGAVEQEVLQELNELKLALLKSHTLLPTNSTLTSRADDSFSMHAHELLSISDDPAAIWSERDLAAYWTKLQSLSVEELLNELSGGPSLIDSESPCNLAVSLQELCTDSHPQLATLKALKDAAKTAGQLSGKAAANDAPSHPFPPVVARVLYGLAIAMARVCCAETITRVSDQATADKFRRTIEFEWIDERTRQSFRTWIDLLDSGSR